MSPLEYEHDDATEPTDQTGLLSDSEETHAASVTPAVNKNRVFLLIALVSATIGCGELLIINPQTRLFESIICRKYYDVHDPSVIEPDGWVSEQLCKIEPVESGVALLLGWQDFFDCIPSLLLAIPFGWLADKYGRKPFVSMTVIAFCVRSTLILIICYFWQTLPLKLVWATSIYAVFGGGYTVANSLALVMVSDVFPNAERASAFLRLSSVALFIGFFAPPLSAVLMKRNFWIPLLLGLLIQFLSIPLVLAIPETLGNHEHIRRTGVELPLPSDAANGTRHRKKPSLLDMLGRVRDSVRFIFQDWRIPTLILTFFVPNSGTFNILYISKRYGWSIADATLLTSIRSGLNVLIFLVLIPALSTILSSRFAFTSLRSDLWLGRASCILSAVGFGVFGFAPHIALSIIGMILFTFGNGHAMFIRSLLTSLVEQHHVARLYNIIGIVNTVALMAGSPLLAGLFQEGLQLGGVWAGLLYYLISGLYLCVTFLMFVVGAREPVWKQRHTFDSDGEAESVRDEDEGQQILRHQD